MKLKVKLCSGKLSNNVLRTEMIGMQKGGFGLIAEFN